MKTLGFIVKDMSLKEALSILFALFVVLVSTRFGGFFSLPPSNISVFWPANALLFSAVYHMQKKQEWIALPLALLAYTAAELWIGYPLRNAIVYSAANVAEVTVLLLLVKNISTRQLTFDNIRDLFALISYAFLASLVGGAIGAIQASQGGVSFGSIFLRWSLADFIGYCLCVPPVLAWGQWRQYFLPNPSSKILEFFLLVATLLSVAAVTSDGVVLGISAPPGAQFLLMPILLWAALRFGPLGGASTTILVAILAFYFSTHGVGLFALGAWKDNVASLQFFFISLVVSVMTVAGLNTERKQSLAVLSGEIAERRQVEMALRQSEENYRQLTQFQQTILNSISYSIISALPDGVITTYNPAAEKLLGYSANEVIGKQMTALWHDRQEVERYASRLSEILGEKIQPGFDVFTARPKRNLTEEAEWTFIRKDGTRVPVNLSVTALRDGEHRITGFVGIFYDLSERKRVEKSLTEYAAIIESTDDAIISKTLDGIVTNWNKGAERMLGYRADEMIGRSIMLLIPDERHDEESMILKKIRHGEHLKHFETVRRCKDGHLIDVSVTISPIHNQQGEIVGASKIARDITEKMRSEEELRRYKDQLEETVQQRTAQLLLARDAAEAANKAKSVFLANMSHELRTPLNAILGFSGLLRHDAQLTEKQRDNLDIINRSGEHLLTLINDVLEIAKIEAGRLQLEIAPFDLGNMVREVLDMMQLRAQEKGLQLAIDQSSEFPRYIKGDEARLRQVLINLLSNAVKFTERGSVAIRLDVKENSHHHLVIVVEDTGPGISEENQQRLFQPFVQLSESGEQQGTGLGLTITRQFVELMGGDISVDSTLGKGSRFRVDIPVEAVGVIDVEHYQQDTHGEIIGMAPGQPHYRVLIAEDQHDNQQLLSYLMTKLGLEVRIVDDGEQCVQQFQEWQPDLIWMDRCMPVMDGVEATRRIRELPGGKAVKIVAVTASAFKEQQHEMLEAGMDDVVLKPYRFDEIYASLAKQLNIQYRYESNANGDALTIKLTPEMLKVLPMKLRNELRDALESLESPNIMAVIHEVAMLDAELGKVLSHYAEDFDYVAILKVLNENS